MRVQPNSASTGSMSTPVEERNAAAAIIARNVTAATAHARCGHLRRRRTVAGAADRSAGFVPERSSGVMAMGPIFGHGAAPAYLLS